MKDECIKCLNADKKYLYKILYPPQETTKKL